MFSFFKKNHNNKPEEGAKQDLPQLLDQEGMPLHEGDEVEALRYDLGRCRIIKKDGHYYYESIQDQKQVIWLKMIDARTQFQKVKKI